MKMSEYRACIRLDLFGPQLLHLCMDFKIILVVLLEEQKCYLKHLFR